MRSPPRGCRARMGAALWGPLREALTYCKLQNLPAYGGGSFGLWGSDRGTHPSLGSANWERGPYGQGPKGSYRLVASSKFDPHFFCP